LPQSAIAITIIMLVMIGRTIERGV